MTYRIAHVRFRKGDRTYPVNCVRSDLESGEIVVVRMQEGGRLKVAELDRVEFLNWRCKNTIIGRRSELHFDSAGNYFMRRETKPQTIETIEQLEAELSKLGWERTGVSSHVYRSVFTRTFDTQGAAIGIRRNGIDFQIYEESGSASVKDGLQRFPDGWRNLAKHSFYGSEVDLLEHAKHFALSAHQPTDELEKFFKPVGRKQPRPQQDRDEMRDIAEAFGGAMTDTERDAFGSW